ncbi:heat shock 70 kDa protein 1A-like [Culicoides brevitarsis]|uniref:heat shock 70 kDa protein 1A-like n=1 Tax=Culicoides brevitarsis TaxID=469753 RepID=UPI00307C5911
MDDLGIGIDIGASKIVVAVCREHKAEVILNSEGSRSTKFCVAFNNKERLFSDAAEGQFSVNPENTIYGRDVKKIIGLQKIALVIDETSVKVIEEENILKFSVQYKNDNCNFSPEAVLLMALNNVKSDIETVLRQKITKAVITVPSTFNSAQRFAVKNAVLAAGIEVESILNDSTASAITYMIERHASDDKNILIFDMGATSTDVAVVKLSGNSVEVKACDGNLDLGGENFVILLLEHFIREFECEKCVRISDNKQLIARLTVACEKIMKMLTSKEEVKYIIDNFYYGEPYEMKINRQSFVNLCSDLYKNIGEIVNGVVAKTKIDEIIFVGNGCQIPSVKIEISKLFVGDVRIMTNEDEFVAKGAAYYAARNFTKASEKLQNLQVKQISMNEFTSYIGKVQSSTKIEKGKILPTEIEAILTFYEGPHHLKPLESSNAILKTAINSDSLVKITCSTGENSLSLVDHQNFDEKLVNQMRENEEILEKKEQEYKKKVNLTFELEKICLEYKRRIKKADGTDIKLSEADKKEMLYEIYDTLDWINECKSPTIDQLTDKIETLKKLCDEKINLILIDEKKTLLKNLTIAYRQKFETNSLLDESDITKIQSSSQEILDWLEKGLDIKIDELNEKINIFKADREHFDEKLKFLENLEQGNVLLKQKNFKEASSVFCHILNNFSMKTKLSI